MAILRYFCLYFTRDNKFQGTSALFSEPIKQPLKNPPGFSDEQITQALLGSLKQREEIFTYLYQSSGWREWVVRHVCREGGDEPAGEDVFQETLILFDRNIREGRFLKGSSLQTYFLGIAKQYWFNRQRKIRPLSMPLEYDPPDTLNPEHLTLQQEWQQMINHILQQIGEHCKKVLELYKLSLSNEEIAREMGLSSPEMAKKYTYRCREKFRAFVLGRKDILEHLDLRLKDAP